MSFQKLQRVKLRKETSLNKSGTLFNENKIPLLKEGLYSILNQPLDGDAPKEFIKAYLYEQDGKVRKHNPDSWHLFIAKTAEKWYPHESVIEYMINCIGHELGLIVNDCYLVRANSQIRFLSKYFLKDDERLTHGAEICGEHLKDYEFAKEVADHKETARELFTFEFIEEAIRCVYPEDYESILTGVIKMITFDGLVGNNDRHFYNWGVIENKKEIGVKPIFSPIYDTARGLFWNMDDENMIHILNVYYSGGKRVDNYVRDASPRIGMEKNNKANHFELISFLLTERPQYREIIEKLSCEECELKVLRYIRQSFFQFFCVERCKLIEIILKKRFQQIRYLTI